MSDSGKTFEGKVDSIGYGVLPDDGGLVLGGLPKVSRSINWVRVAQRFPETRCRGSRCLVASTFSTF